MAWADGGNDCQRGDCIECIRPDALAGQVARVEWRVPDAEQNHWRGKLHAGDDVLPRPMQGYTATDGLYLHEGSGGGKRLKRSLLNGAEVRPSSHDMDDLKLRHGRGRVLSQRLLLTELSATMGGLDLLRF